MVKKGKEGRKGAWKEKKKEESEGREKKKMDGGKEGS